MIAADLWCLEFDVIVTILAAWYSEWLGVLAEGCGRFYYYYYYELASVFSALDC